MSTRFVIGVDEVGRGPIAGPLCVGACLMPRDKARELGQSLVGIRESKQLTHQSRVEWLRVLTKAAQDGECRFSTVFISEKTIDTRGLSFALKSAIARVLKKLGADPQACEVLLDGGIHAPEEFVCQQTIIKGDEKEPLIASASIVAKVRRDRYMMRLGKRYPCYGFEAHKGYGTRQHYAALEKHGILDIHRRSFLRKFRISNFEYRISKNTKYRIR